MVEYRPMSKSDLRAIWACNRADHPNDPRWALWEEEYIRYNDDGMAVTIGAFVGEDPVGEVTLLLDPSCPPIGGRTELAGNGAANVNALRVFREFRGLGYGSGLVRAAEKLAREMKIHRLTIGVEQKEARNRAIYHHLGYRQELFRAVEEGEEIIYLQKEI